MIIPVKIDDWTRRNFRHAPVSLRFRRVSYFGRFDPELGGPFAQHSTDFAHLCESQRTQMGSGCHLEVRLRRRIPCGNSFITFDKKCFGHTLYNNLIPNLRNELAQQLSQEFHRFLKANAAREIIQSRNIREWR